MGAVQRLPWSADSARELFTYDASTGALKWRASRCVGVRPGRKGYRRIRHRRRSYQAARLIWLIVHGRDPWPLQIDHINGDKSDDRLVNLRLATNAQNQANKKATRANTSGFKGVSFSKSKGRWRAYIKHDQRYVHLGYFADPEAAHAAYVESARVHFGEFANSGA